MTTGYYTQIASLLDLVSLSPPFLQPQVHVFLTLPFVWVPGRGIWVTSLEESIGSVGKTRQRQSVGRLSSRTRGTFLSVST